MKLRSIELEGFQSYRRRVHVPLHDMTMTAIAGTNHVGKSSLFDAIEFALYGRSRGSSVSDVISRGEGRAEVAVEFDLNEAAYRVVRTRTRKGRHEVMVSVQDPDDPTGWRELTEKNSLQADEVIINLVGMDAQAARATWVIGQNDFGSFCDMRPADRRNVLSNIYGLHRFTDLAKRAEKKRSSAALEQEKASERQRTLQAQYDALDAPGPFPLLTDDELAEQGRDHETRAEAAAVELASLEDPNLEANCDAAAKDLAEFEQAHRDAVARHNTEVSRAGARVNDATAAAAAADAAAADAAAACNEMAAARSAVDAARDAVKEATETVSLVRDECTAGEAQVAALTAERESISQRGLQLKQRIDSLETSVQHGHGECFTCRQGLSTEQAQELLHEQRAERESLLTAHSEKSTQIRQATTELAGRQERLTQAETNLQSARGDERSAENSAADVARRADAYDQTHQTAADTRQRLKAATAELEELGDSPALDEQRHAALKDRADALRKAVDDAQHGGHRDALTERRNTARESARAVTQEQQRREHVTTEKAKLEEPIADAAEAVATATGDVDTFTVLHEAFKPTGIPSMILAGVVEELNEEANDILGGLGDDGLGVHVSTRKENARGGAEEKVMVYAITASGHVDYGTLSGSEKFRIAIALRLGLARCIARRTGSPVETILMDEGWGTLDEVTKRAVQDVLTRLSAEFAIFTITHIDEVRDAFPTSLTVSSPDGSSQVEVSS